MKSVTHPQFQLREYLLQQKNLIDRYLDRFLPAADQHPKIIHEAMRYGVLSEGKRIRPILALATGDALDGNFEQLIRLACALETIHAYSLIHDDLPCMDDDDFRRGIATVHKRFGEGIAVLAGDALLTLAFQLLSEVPGAGAERKCHVIQTITRSIGTVDGMIGGQVLDLMTQGKPFSTDELRYIHLSKTGALIRASVYCAGILSGASEETCERLNAFGSHIGLIFQIVDDILDVEGSLEKLGKSSGKDQVRNKATYPALYGIPESRRIVADLEKAAYHELEVLGSHGEILCELTGFIASRTS
ncbi:MAG: polyprenyl synthetase family protein [Acidobacteria bacterium]|nr:polyprenyl synthetase family protein [Acidobacteriota bacterium]